MYVYLIEYKQIYRNNFPGFLLIEVARMRFIYIYHKRKYLRLGVYISHIFFFGGTNETTRFLVLRDAEKHLRAKKSLKGKRVARVCRKG